MPQQSLVVMKSSTVSFDSSSHDGDGWTICAQGGLPSAAAVKQHWVPGKGVPSKAASLIFSVINQLVDH
eukprot:4070443-Lingulodinium_polyedra.AAC.1